MYVFLYFMHIFCIFPYFSIGFYHKKQHKVSFQEDSITQKQFSKQKISVTLRNKTSRLFHY